jgi:hypothetical protein
MATWKVEYGPFDDELIELVARSWGWHEKRAVEAIDYVTEKMKQFNIEKLSQAKINYELQDIESQVENVKDMVKVSVEKAIKIEVVE